MSQPWLKKKINALELYTIDVILGRRADTGAAIYGAFLQSLSWLFSGIVQTRWWL
jgi:tetraacyldisaccharide 4'-kinase